MRTRLSFSVFLFLFLIQPGVGYSAESTDLPYNAYDGRYFSAETLGRGGTSASGLSSLGAGASSPAGLSGSQDSSLYTSLVVGLSTTRPKSEISNQDPTGQKTLQNLAMGSDRGVVFYEPLGRHDADEPSTLNSLDATRHVDFAADAIGFAASDKWKDGSVGLSLAYLYSSLGEITTSSATTAANTDRGYGVRMNMAIRRPTGPVMWGLQLQNFPGFLWWNDHKRDILPVKIRIGNTWRIKSGVLFSMDFERRYYNEGSLKKNYGYFGAEAGLSSTLTLRMGAFSDDIGRPDHRHYTGGLTWKMGSNVDISYALDQYEDLNEKVKQSILSVRVPLAMDNE